MKTCRIKLSAIAVASLLTFSNSYAMANDVNFDRANKELTIMSKIFETSLSEKSSNTAKILGSTKSEATYLAKQGMLFTFNFGRNTFGSNDEWEQFGAGIGHLVGAIASEVGNSFSDFPNIEPPEAPEAPEFGFDEHFEVYQERIEALEHMRDEQRNQREEVRELQREIRALERKNSSDSEESKSLEKSKKQLDEKMQVLNKRMAEYQKSMDEYRATRDKKYTQNAKLKSETIVSTLCDYGATLRSLEKGEHITLIFKNFNDNKDQIYVFEYEDVRECASKEKLLKSAISYQS